MKKILIAGTVVLFLGAGVYVALTQKKTDDSASRHMTPSWQITENGTDDSSGAPKSKVALTINGSTHQLGTYVGTCSEISASAWTLLEYETSGVICWWAGGGQEIGLFEDSKGLTVRVGDLDEGSDETPGVRGNFRTLVELK
jgi:hypothetical protein